MNYAYVQRLSLHADAPRPCNRPDESEKNEHMNASEETSVPLLCLLATALMLSACSRSEPEQASSASMTPPLVTAPATPQNDSPAATVELVAGGMPTRYTPYYQGTTLTRIEEERQADDRSERGEYEFYGARLVRYYGAPLASGGTLELKFDVDGGLVSASHSQRAVQETDIAAIRGRASLLRNHALAQHATMTHGH